MRYPEVETGIGTLPGRESGSLRRRPNVLEWILIAVVVLYTAGLLIGPLIAMTWGSLAEGPRAFAEQISKADALHALELTLLLSLGATIINAIFGVAVSWVLVRDDFKGKKLVNGLIDLPFVIPPVVAGLMLILLFGRDGWFTSVTDALGLKIVFAWPGMLLVTIFVSLPFVIREVMPVLSQVGVEQENAAYTMGASAWQAFRHITLPAIRWGLLYGISLTFARSLGEFGAILVVSGGVSGLTETSTLYIFRSLDDRNYVAAYATATVLAAISFVILLGMEFFRKRSLET
jgi:sulfate transport system permease protein